VGCSVEAIFTIGLHIQDLPILLRIQYFFGGNWDSSSGLEIWLILELANFKFY